MKTKIFIMGLICLVFSGIILSQEKDLIATTEDGRKVLLKADGTWEFLKEQPEKEWREVAKWEGNSIKNTETFHISTNTWAIDWSTKPGKFGNMNFQIYVYRENEDLVGIAANVIGEEKDRSIMRGKGNYYLMINSGQPYSIIILEKVK